MKRIVYTLIVIAAVVGCSPEGREFTPVFPALLSAEARQLLTDSLPKMRRAAPGLDRYARDLRLVAVDESTLHSSDPDYRRITLHIALPDGRSSIPSEYKALGHTCFVDISHDGRWLTVTKTPCKRVLLDRDVAYTPDPLVLALR